MKERRKDKLAQVKEQGLTYDDYVNMPDDGNRYELVDGQLELMSPAPTITHQVLLNQINLRLSESCSSEYLILFSPIDVVLSTTEVRQPDIIMIHLARQAAYKNRSNIVEPPDLVVEIVSPSSLNRDKIAKRHAYAKFGVPEYWIVNPMDESLEQYILKSDGTYDLQNVYIGDELVRSEKLTCVSFTMDDVMRKVQDISKM